MKKHFIPYLVLLLALTAFPTVSTAVAARRPLPVLIIDGQANKAHDWRATTPALKKILEDTGLFHVDVLTSPPAGEDMNSFKPIFKNYKVIVMNYDGDPWPKQVQSDLERYMQNGGGLVCYHASDNAFPAWREYNKMIGVGGWEGRNETAGPHWYFKDGKLVSDDTPGPAGKHGLRKPFQVVTRDPNHPITKGLPAAWMHVDDELYSKLRGPGENMTVLATAFSDPTNRGSGHDEPMLMALHYGKGRVFHTTMGHDLTAMACIGFITTLQRGTEWAAIGKVTQAVPKNFPTADAVMKSNDPNY